MRSPRIFTSVKLNIKQQITLDRDASWHILQVLRLHPNNTLRVFNNIDGEFQAHLVTGEKNRALVFLDEFIKVETESPIEIHLGQGISRGEKMDFTIQKAVELGVTSVTPLFTTYCNVKLEQARLEKKLLHWQKVAISAAEQSGRIFVPQILPMQNIVSWYQTLTCGLKIVFDPSASNKISSIKERPKIITILIGPEGGLSDEEIALAKNHHFMPITLGPRILRTETSALTAISIMQAQWGDI